jgi:hypothetical protein
MLKQAGKGKAKRASPKADAIASFWSYSETTKGLRAKCLKCGHTFAKNVSRQAQHMETCPKAKGQPPAKSPVPAGAFGAPVPPRRATSSSSASVVSSSTAFTSSSRVKVADWMTRNVNVLVDELYYSETALCLARFEPVSRLVDPFFKPIVLLGRPLATSLVIQSVQTIYSRYVSKIHKQSLKYMKELFESEPGELGVSADGFTAHHGHFIAFTVSKGRSTYDSVPQCRQPGDREAREGDRCW